jgi:hypothetical protein
MEAAAARIKKQKKVSKLVVLAFSAKRLLLKNLTSKSLRNKI